MNILSTEFLINILWSVGRCFPSRQLRIPLTFVMDYKPISPAELVVLDLHAIRLVY